MNQAKRYFIMAEQYYSSAKVLLEEMISSGNYTCGFGKTENDAEKEMLTNSSFSDAKLFLPALFLCYQSVELFIKGVLKLNEKNIEKSHEMSNMLNDLRQIYGSKEQIYKEFYDFYKYQIEILNKYTKENDITTIKELYESLRYPENRGREYSYQSLRYNGKYGIKMFENLLEKIQKIRENVLTEYKNRVD